MGTHGLYKYPELNTNLLLAASLIPFIYVEVSFYNPLLLYRVFFFGWGEALLSRGTYRRFLQLHGCFISYLFFLERNS